MDAPELTAAERLDRMARGREAFNRGEFFEAHELWEEVWNESDDPERTWIQGLIQVATALHKLGRGRDDVCEILLRKALPKLASAPTELTGVDVESARGGAKRVLDGIAAGRAPEPTSVRV